MKSKKLNLLTQTFFSIAFFCSLAASFNLAHAADEPAKRAAAVAREKRIVEEVAKVKTIDEAEAELEKTQKTIASYTTTLRQVYRGLYSEDYKEIEDQAEGVRTLIQEQRRKVELLEAKIDELEASSS